MGIRRRPPSFSISRSCRTRSSFACSASGMSPTSSRKTVPPRASSNFPGRASTPVATPRSMPKSSDSRSVSGSAAQLMATNGPSLRGEFPWISRATISLPVPDSPADEHVRLTVGHARHEIDHALHLRRVADHQSIGVLAQHALLEVAILILQRLADDVEPVVVAGVVDRRGADGSERGEKAQVVLDEAAALRAALFLSADAEDADDVVAGDHRRDQEVAGRPAEKPGHGDGDRLPRCSATAAPALRPGSTRGWTAARTRTRRDAARSSSRRWRRRSRSWRRGRLPPAASTPRAARLPAAACSAHGRRRKALRAAEACVEAQSCFAALSPFRSPSCTRRGGNRNSMRRRTAYRGHRF